MCPVATKLFANFDFNLRGKFMFKQSHKTFKDLKLTEMTRFSGAILQNMLQNYVQKQ